MRALMGTGAILLMYLCAGWIGYQLGVDRGVRMERTKRGIGREVR